MFLLTLHCLYMVLPPSPPPNPRQHPLCPTVCAPTFIPFIILLPKYLPC